MVTAELDTLILHNLADLDATAQRLERIEETVWRAVDSVVERWAKEHGWVGVFDIVGRGLWIVPARWRVASEDEDNPDASFWFELSSRDPPTSFDLSDLCGIGGSRYGFRFHQKLLGKVQWKELARKHVPTFHNLGLQLDSKASAFIETVIDPKKLALDVESGDFLESLSPIADALDRLAAADKALRPLLFKAGANPPARQKPTRAASRMPVRRSK